MRFDEIMLGKQERRKLELFQVMSKLSLEQCTIHYLQSLMVHSYSRVKTLVESIELDLRNFFAPDLQLLDAQGIQVVRLQAFRYEDYYSRLVLSGVPYMVVKAMLVAPEMDLNAFCQHYYYSPSSVKRKTAGLAAYVGEYGLKLNLAQLELVGDERFVRMVFYSLLWLAGKQLPPEEQQVAGRPTFMGALQPYLPNGESIASEHQLSLLYDVCSYRFQKGHYIEIPAKHETYLNRLDFTTVYPMWQATTAVQQAEIDFILYWLTAIPNFYDYTDPRLAKMVTYITQQPLNGLIQRLVDAVRSQFPQDFFWQDTCFWGNLTNIVLLYYQVEKPVPIMFDLVRDIERPHFRTWHEAKQLFQLFFQTEAERTDAWLLTCLPEMAELLADVVEYSLKQAGQTKKLRVALIAESNVLITDQLLNFVTNLGFVEITALNHDSQAVDAIIATSRRLIPAIFTQPCFVVQPTRQKMQDLELYYQLVTLWYEKNQL